MENENKTEATIMKRPMGLTIVAVLLFSAGLAGVISDCLRNGGFAIPSYNLFNTIAGIGLLNLWRVARWYALLVVGLALLSALLEVFVLSGSQLSGHTISIFGQTRNITMTIGMMLFTMLIAYANLLVWMLWVLMRRDV
jgi:hypothetical protein